MGCDNFFDENGEFEVEYRCEQNDGSYTEHRYIINGKPLGKIYKEIFKGDVR